MCIVSLYHYQNWNKLSELIYLSIDITIIKRHDPIIDVTVRQMPDSSLSQIDDDEAFVLRYYSTNYHSDHTTTSICRVNECCTATYIFFVPSNVAVINQREEILLFVFY